MLLHRGFELGRQIIVYIFSEIKWSTDSRGYLLLEENCWGISYNPSKLWNITRFFLDLEDCNFLKTTVSYKHQNCRMSHFWKRAVKIICLSTRDTYQNLWEWLYRCKVLLSNVFHFCTEKLCTWISLSKTYSYTLQFHKLYVEIIIIKKKLIWSANKT